MHRLHASMNVPTALLVSYIPLAYMPVSRLSSRDIAAVADRAHASRRAAISGIDRDTLGEIWPRADPQVARPVSFVF